MSPRTSSQIEALKAKRVSEILDAAFNVFAEEGYHNASVSKIAKRANISKGLMYNYFEGKEHVLRSIMQNLMDEIAELYDFEHKKELTTEDVLQWIDFSFDIVQQDIKRWKLYMALSMQPDVTPIFMEMAHSVIQSFTLKLLNFFKSKEMENPMEFMRHFSALIDGIQMHIVLSPNQYPIEYSRKLLKDQIKNL